MRRWGRHVREKRGFPVQDFRCGGFEGVSENVCQRLFGATRLPLAALLLTLALVQASSSAAAEWNPAAFAKEDTLKLRTIGPEEGEHWFPVWLVVIDDQVYVRLGSRAAGRVERNTTAPYLGVEVAGQRFDHVRGVPVPGEAERVAKAMAEKYTSDIIVRWMSHPLTLRLVPDN
jgi:hypothetical protein